MVNLYKGQIYGPRQIIIGHVVVADSWSAVGVEPNFRSDSHTQAISG